MRMMTSPRPWGINTEWGYPEGNYSPILDANGNPIIEISEYSSFTRDKYGFLEDIKLIIEAINEYDK